MAVLPAAYLAGYVLEECAYALSSGTVADAFLCFALSMGLGDASAATTCRGTTVSISARDAV